jgi:hypothetical protein
MVADKFTVFVEKEKVKDLIPFLKELTKEEKKELAPVIKKLYKEYSEFRQFDTTFRQKGSPDQIMILHISAFCTLNRAEYEKIDSFNNLFSYSSFIELLDWYCPDWFSDFINGLIKRNWMPWQFTYEVMMTLTKKGYLMPSDELVARLLPELIFVREGQQSNYAPLRLEKWPETLKQHVWLLFQFETSIPFSDNFAPYNQKIDWPEHRWMRPLKQYAENGMLDRSQLLRESILASARNFNKNLTGWFIDLFIFLEPTSDEIISLQPELFIALNSPHSKAVNTILSSLKTIGADRNFQATNFFENVPLLLASETKTTISSTLQLLEKIIKGQPEHKVAATLLACLAFIHADEAIQTKAVKIILKNAADSQLVASELNNYQDSLLMSARKALQPMLIEREQSLHATVEKETEAPIFYERLVPPATLDELIFLASQAFDNNDPLHIDLLPAAIVNFQNQLTGTALSKFEPALQRAYKMVMGDWPSTMGYLDHLVATYFIDLTKVLIDRHPNAGASLKVIHQSFKAKDDESKAKWKWYEGRILAFTTWTMHSRDTTYAIHKSVLYISYLKVLNNDQTPLLSTPTHACGFVDPMELVQRLQIYQSKNVLPDNLDFQLAISRLAPFHHKEALHEARSSITGETLAILEFMLVPDAKPQPPFITSSLWFIAAITKNPAVKYEEFKSLPYAKLADHLTTGIIAWRSFTETYFVDQYNYQKRINEKIEKKQNVLRLSIEKSRVPVQARVGAGSFLSGITNWLTSLGRDKLKEVIEPQHNKKYVQCLYEYPTLKGQFLSAERNDIARFLYLFPSNPNPLLSLITGRVLAHSTPNSENDKRILSKTLESLMPLRFAFNESTHLFLASCMLCSDKTVRSFAAELWISAMRSTNVNSARIGEIIGIHQQAEYAPLKRFTDLISSNLLNISPRHNQQLEILLTKVLEQLSNDPPVGTKKLLELYSELLSMNHSSVGSEHLLEKFNVWKESGTLKKTIESLS